MAKKIRLATCVLSRPVHWLSQFVPHKNRVVIVSVAFLAGGPFIASLEIAHIPHVLLDSFGYLIHGCGCAPLVDKYLKGIEL